MTTEAHDRAIELAREADFALGDLRVRPAAREVEAAAGKTTLEPRVMQVLVALARHAGSVVSRDELIAQCWAGRVVGDDAIHRCVARLRRLADSHGGFVVETVPKVGYRLQPQEPHAHAAPAAASAPAARAATRLNLAFGAAAALAILAIAAWGWRAATVERAEQGRLVEAEQGRLVERITELVQNDQYGEAFRLALPLANDARLEQDAWLRKAWEDMVLPMKPLVAEDGATVYFKAYADMDGEWFKAGITPFAAAVPAPRGTLRLKVSKPGFRTAYFAVANPGPSVVNEPPDPRLERNAIGVPLPLVELGSVPDDMVIVPRTDVPVWVPGWTPQRQGGFRREIPSFLIARSEVTNQQFKEFVDAHAYENADYWEGRTFVENGKTLSWTDARAKFVDSTQRPGPAEWQLSTYPEGQGSYPVGGISWYEAVAYARFRGQMLPTVHHWARAAFAPVDPRFNVAPAVAASSRFSALGPLPADAEVGLGPWGTFQMAGNVREWLWNSAGATALAPGGAWSDYASENWGAFPLAPMDRSPTNGIRLMQTPADAALVAELSEPIRLIDGELRSISPVSDEAFAAMLLQFDQAHFEPVDVSISVIEQTPLWSAEEIVLTFAEAERTTLYIVSPRSHSKPLQPIVYAPPANCCVLKLPNRAALEQMQEAGFVVDGGRALIIPIWSGSYQRFAPLPAEPRLLADRQRESALAWQRDMRIVLDYVATRSDIDSERAGFLGASIGAFGQAIVLAIEPRIKVAALMSGGIPRFETPHPMADIVNYAPRIKIPVMMINGRMDHLLPYATAQQPLLELLGTDAASKALINYDGGHYQYRSNTVARHVTDWFDRYLGPAR